MRCHIYQHSRYYQTCGLCSLVCLLLADWPHGCSSHSTLTLALFTAALLWLLAAFYVVLLCCTFTATGVALTGHLAAQHALRCAQWPAHAPKDAATVLNLSTMHLAPPTKAVLELLRPHKLCFRQGHVRVRHVLVQFPVCMYDATADNVVCPYGCVHCMCLWRASFPHTQLHHAACSPTRTP